MLIASESARSESMVAYAPHSHIALNRSWNREPGDDSDDQGEGSDHDDQRDPDCERHAPISLHVRSDQTQGVFLYHTENLPSEGAHMSIGR
jgi:hypothetical protein